MRFLGTGSAAPAKVLTNDMLAAMVDTSDEWIRTRTGILERRIVQDETSFDLSLEAARLACEEARQSGISYSDIDMVICATVSHEYRCPSLASRLQNALGLRKSILAFDLNAACSGFIYALIVASRFVDEGKRVLLVGCELLSSFVDFTDRSTCVLFGDAAGAAVVAPRAHNKTGTDDRWLNEAAVSKDFYWVAETEGNVEMLSIVDVLKMDGQGVFKFAVSALLRTIRAVVEESPYELDEIDLFICHQANERIIKSAAKRLGVSLDRFFINLHKYGNTSAASIPLALDEARQAGALAPGTKLVMAGFGGGLTAGAVCFAWS